LTAPGWNPHVQPPQAPPPPQKNVIGLIAVVTGIVGFIFACIPGALIIGWILLPIAFILGIVGMFQSGKRKATSIAAIVVSIIGAIVGVAVFATVIGNSFDDAFNGSDLSVASSPSANSPGSGEDKTSSEGAPSRGTRGNPLPIGESVSDDEWTITLGQPQNAGSIVASENRFNDPPEPGMEFWMVPVNATYKGDKTGNVSFGVRVQFVGSDNRTYSDSCGVIPDPLSDVGELYAGGVAEGNVCVAVPAGASGLWTVSTGFTGDPVFFQ
jgi:hypothetical protein